MDAVNHPAHYNAGGIECIDAMVAAMGAEAVQNFCIGNAMKYIWRCGKKGDAVEDLMKADWYIMKAIALEENETQEVEQV